MDRLELDELECEAIAKLLAQVPQGTRSPRSRDLLPTVAVLAHELPERVRHTLNAFRLEQMSGVLTISGQEVDDEVIGPTPAHWREPPVAGSLLDEEVLLLMYASLLGDPFGWKTQQDGRLIHNVVPIHGHENEQIGSSSTSLLTWHTEDAFHPLRGDYLMFACLRNPTATPTMVGSVDDIRLDDSAKSVLFQPRFCILPDDSHTSKNNSEDSEGDFSAIDSLRHDPDPIPILFGDPATPYIRVDPYFMTVSDDDAEAQSALATLVEHVDQQMVDLVLAPGDFCALDNFRIVHGRKPFAARHDGNDRWLKRVNVTRDLRKSRASRRSVADRAIQ